MKTFSRRLFVLLIVVLLVGGQPSIAASLASARAEASPAAHSDGAASGQAVQPLDSLLQPDGTLNLNMGFSGSLDPRGWRMISPPGEPPRFVRAESTESGMRASASLTPTAPGDEFWDDRFDVLGVSGYVRAIAVSGDNVYVGGSFGAVGSLVANNIARWNSVEGKWYPLATPAANGTNGPVHAIAIYRDYVYVGGAFTSAGNATAYNIARWDNLYNTWSALGVGMNNTVRALAIDPQGIVFAGGDFGDVEGPNSQYLAAWVSGHWTALGVGVSGPSGPVYAIALTTIGSTVVYVGGKFLDAGGKPNTEHIAAFAAGSWWPVGNGLSNTVYALAASGYDVYAGGEFGDVGRPNTHNFAHWNGSAWFPVGAGVNGTVRTIALVGNDVYIGGEFLSAGGVNNTHSIARWDGSGWSALGSGASGYVYDVALGTDGIYVGGLFNAAGGKPSRNFGRWFGNQSNPPPPPPADSKWDGRFGPTGLGPNSIIYTVALDGPNLYVGGEFTMVGNVSANHIARWDGSRWWALGDGVAGSVSAIAVQGSNVYVGGNFIQAGSVTASHIARWNGSQWSAMDTGVFGGGEFVLAIAVSGSNVYVGGWIALAGDPSEGTDVAVNNIARWDGSHWSALGSGVNGIVRALAVSGGIVYAGGDFDKAGDASVGHIARWNGSRWSALGSGLVDGGVIDIEVSGSDIYVVGGFTTAGEKSANGIAKWNGSSWSALGSGVGQPSMAIAVSGSNVYAGGGFTTAGGVTVNNIARWDGSAWSPLGSGITGNWGVYALATNGADVFVGGYFTTAGGKPSQHFAIYHTGYPPAPGGSIWGNATSPGGVPLASASVQACPFAGGACLWSGITDSDGVFVAASLPAGTYTMKVYPPAGSSLRPFASAPLTLPENGSLSGQDISLRDYRLLPAGANLTPSQLGSLAVPRVRWSQPLSLAAQGCLGGSASYQISQGGAVLRSGALAQNPAGKYSAGISPLAPYAGDAEARITIQCPAGLTPQAETVINFDLYIEPDFTVRALGGRPLAGASVTLYSYNAATGNFQAVPNGDARMGPINRANPDTTDGSGQFGWDLSAGFYKVRAAKAGCVSPNNPAQLYVESEILVVPLPATDLDLRLDCGEKVVYLPVVLR